MYRSILVPLDGSALAESALPVAIHLARRHSAQLELINIEISVPTVVISAGLSVREVAPETARPAAMYLEDVARRISEVYPVAVKQTVRSAYAHGVPVLLQYAKDEDIDLIVIATHGYGPFKRFWLGSFADAVARQSRIPTLLVRPTQDARVNLEAEPRFRHILIALDGSTAAAAIVEHAHAVGDEQADYTLFQAVAPVVAASLDYSYMPVPMDYALTPLAVDNSLLAARREGAQTYLDGVASSFRQRGLNAETVVVDNAFPASAILDHAEENDIDLIALTTHGYGGAMRLLLGSVADKVVRGADVPVLLYRPPAES